jgi:hypothetical protein
VVEQVVLVPGIDSGFELLNPMVRLVIQHLLPPADVLISVAIQTTVAMMMAKTDSCLLLEYSSYSESMRQL